MTHLNKGSDVVYHGAPCAPNPPDPTSPMQPKAGGVINNDAEAGSLKTKRAGKNRNLNTNRLNRNDITIPDDAE